MTSKTDRFRIALSILTITVVAATALAAAPAGRALRPLRLLAELASRVDLTPEQRGQVRSIFAARRAEIVAIVDRERTSRTALRQAIQRPQVDSAAVRAASAEVAAVDAELAVERARIYTEVAAVLTPDQMAAIEGFISEVRPMIEAEIDRAMSAKAQLKALDVGDDQRAQIREILASHRDALEALAVSERHVREALVATIRQPAVDEAAVREASAAVAAVDADLAVERARLAAEIGAVLTPEQRARARQRIERLHESFFGRAIEVYDLGLRLL